jgi:hypothetical protein
MDATGSDTRTRQREQLTSLLDGQQPHMTTSEAYPLANSLCVPHTFQSI